MTELERFLKRLVEVLEARDPSGVHRPFSIDDLRRSVMPYRQHRAAIGLTSSEDYELLVLRLIAEEGGYGRAYPAEAAERARVEIGSPNPDLDLVDELAETTIQIGAPGLARILAAAAAVSEPIADSPPDGFPGPDPDGHPGQSAPIAPNVVEVVPLVDILAPSAVESEPGLAPVVDAEPGPAPVPSSVDSVRGSPSVPPAAQPESAPPPAPVPPTAPEPELFEPIADGITVDDVPTGAGSGPHQGRGSCPGCHAGLPSHRPVTFCPFCGFQIGARNCSRCGAEIEPGWRHCVVCGHQAAPGAFA